jgi:biotin transporter BioY
MVTEVSFTMRKLLCISETCVIGWGLALHSLLRYASHMLLQWPIYNGFGADVVSKQLK